MESPTNVTRHRTQKRPWLAALLAFLQPGLGHVYLRAWARALLWFVLWVTTVVLVAPLPAEPAGEGFGAVFVEAAGALDALSFEASLALLSVTVFSMLDAYWLAARDRKTGDGAPRCPACRREVDPGLNFCHWCTAEFEAPEEAGGDRATRAGRGR